MPGIIYINNNPFGRSVKLPLFYVVDIGSSEKGVNILSTMMAPLVGTEGGIE